MHSLSKELLDIKVIYLGNANIMKKKRQKLMRLSRKELIQVATEVRIELNQPWITNALNSDFVTKSKLIQDVIMFTSVTKSELVQDIMSTIKNSVKSSFK